jgi:phosphoglycolate phosphatase
MEKIPEPDDGGSRRLPRHPLLVLFDIDGTLILTGGAGMRALDRACFEVVGLPGGMSGVKADGKTDPIIIEEIFLAKLGRSAAAHEIDAVLERYVVHLADEVARTPRYDVMPGVERALTVLEGAGATVGLATGNIRRGAQIKLERGDLWRRFAFGGYACDAADRTQLVARGIERGHAHAGRRFAPEETWVIGDTPRDVAAAHGCGVKAIGVATGPHKVDALRAAGADLVWETLEELPEWLPERSPT